jgi:hypothetical protein
MSNKEGEYAVSPQTTAGTVAWVDQTSHRSAALNFGPFHLYFRSGQLFRGRREGGTQRCA